MAVSKKEVMQQAGVLIIPEAAVPLRGSMFKLLSSTEEKGLAENDLTPENSAHLLPITEAIIRYAAGQISYQQYCNKLDAWWEKNKEAWQENDLSRLFLLVCLTN